MKHFVIKSQKQFASQMNHAFMWSQGGSCVQYTETCPSNKIFEQEICKHGFFSCITVLRN